MHFPDLQLILLPSMTSVHRPTLRHDGVVMATWVEQFHLLVLIVVSDPVILGLRPVYICCSHTQSDHVYSHENGATNSDYKERHEALLMSEESHVQVVKFIVQISSTLSLQIRMVSSLKNP